jgi:hypothetical protein
MSRRSRRAWAGMVVAGLAAVLIGLSTDLQSPPRYDGAGYSVLGLSILSGRGYREIDQPVATLHAHFPPGYPLVLAGLWALTGRSVAAAHLFSIACTLAATWLAWRWFRRIEPPAVANLLGAALAVNWMWSAVGGSIQSEPLYLVLSMMVLLFARQTGIRASLGLGVLIGLCVLTRHVGFCLVVAVLIDRIWVRTGDSRRTVARAWLEAATIGLAAAITVAPWIYWMGTVRRNTQVGLLESGGIASRVASQTLFYVRRLPDSLTGPFIEVATVFSRSKAVGWSATLGAVAVSTVILVGLIRATCDPRKRVAGLVPLVTLPLLLVWPFTEAGRFLIPLVPCLLVGLVEGLSGLARLERFPLASRIRLFVGSAVRTSESRPDRRRPHSGPNECRNGRAGTARTRSPRKLAAAFALLAAIPYPAYSLISHRARAQRQTHRDFDAACSWIAREATRPGPVLSRHPGEVFWQTGRQAVTPVSNDLESLADQIHDQSVAYLLVDPDRFAGAAPTPLASFARDRPGRVRKVFAGPVEVYEIHPR